MQKKAVPKSHGHLLNGYLENNMEEELLHPNVRFRIRGQQYKITKAKPRRGDLVIDVRNCTTGTYLYTKHGFTTLLLKSKFVYTKATDLIVRLHEKYRLKKQLMKHFQDDNTKLYVKQCGTITVFQSSKNVSKILSNPVCRKTSHINGGHMR